MEGEGGGVHIQVRGTSELINYKNMGEEEVVKKPGLGGGVRRR